MWIQVKAKGQCLLWRNTISDFAIWQDFNTRCHIGNSRLVMYLDIDLYLLLR